MYVSFYSYNAIMRLKKLSRVNARSRSGQNRSKFEVRISDYNWCLSVSVLYFEFIGGICIPVSGLQTPPPAKKNN